MKSLEPFKIAIQALKSNKLRSCLTMLGIIIGVSAVILLISIGAGLKTFITQQFESLGTNVIFVLPGQVLSDKGELSFGQGPPNFAGSKLNLSLVRDLAKLGPPIVDTSAFIEIPAPVSFKKESKFTTVVGTTENLPQVRNIKAEIGQFISKADLNSSRKTAVIGPSLAQELFQNQNPLNQKIAIAKTRYKIIGVTEKKGGGFGVDFDNAVYIPITTAQKQFGLDSVQSIHIKVSDQNQIQQAIQLVKTRMLKTLNKDEFSVIDQSELLKTISSILGVLTAALGGIAAISLLVGGIGIMNIMLVSVTERTREIGLRKAVGAAPRHILTQFLIEAIVLSFTGGAIGVALGAGGSLLINRFFTTTLTPWSIFLAFGFSALVGIIFGLAPALKASRLNPIDALRYE